MNASEKIIRTALDLGEAMLQTGGEVSRVEDTIRRFLTAYHFSHIEVFSITSQIIVTAVSESEEMVTETRRIRKLGTDLEKLEELNALCRQACGELPDVARVAEQIAEIKAREKPHPVIEYIGAILGAGAFTIFFGGDLLDGLAVGVIAVFVTFLNRLNASRNTQVLLYFLLCAVSTGVLANVLYSLGFGHNLDMILIGTVMLTIPGISTTYSVRDMLQGDTITGLLRFVESMLLALAIAAGYVFTNLFFGGVG